MAEPMVDSKTEQQQRVAAAIIAELHATLLDVLSGAQVNGVEITLRIGPGGHEWDCEVKRRTRHRLEKR